MNIYTYHIDVEGMADSVKLIDLWKQSWAKMGWNPMVLTREHSQRHPQYNDLVNHFNNHLPTINPKQYELACYERWLAMVVVGGGWMSDSDVINWSFFPNRPKSEDLICFSKGSICPCLVYGGEEAYASGIKLFLSHRGGAINPAHASDQDILNLHPDKIKHSLIVEQHGNAGWENASLVHFNHGSMEGRHPRHEWIPKIRPLP